MRDFTILILPGAYSASVAVTQDILAAAAAVARHMNCPGPAWRTVSPDGGLVPLSAGLSIDTQPLPRPRKDDRSLWIVPGLGLGGVDEINAVLSSSASVRSAEVLKRHVENGGCAAASCSGVFLLQAAGLLQGRRATTSWWLAPQLAKIAPDCIVESDRILVCDGAITTAGAAFAQTDLMLHLIQKRFGESLAQTVSKVLLLDRRQAQSMFVVPSMLASGNTLLERLTTRIERTLPDVPSVAGLAREFGMSERTLARRVRAATGAGPSALIQQIRLNRARALLADSRLPLEEIAARVGYEDPSALWRLMRKLTGRSPGKFRSD